MLLKAKGAGQTLCARRHAAAAGRGLGKGDQVGERPSGTVAGGQGVMAHVGPTTPAAPLSERVAVVAHPPHSNVGLPADARLETRVLPTKRSETP